MILHCDICNDEFDDETEGGVTGWLGMIPFSFCVTCYAGVVEMVRDQEPYDDE
jgi:hypothetical protein